MLPRFGEVCGCIVCVPLAGILAIVFGILGLNNANKDAQRSGKGMAIAGITLGGVGILFSGLLMISILLPALNRARETANRIKCASNERQIGMAIVLYTTDHNGPFPPDLGTLAVEEDVSPNVFICPSGNTPAPPSNMTPDQLKQWVNNNSDYEYAGANLTRASDPANMVLYERDSSHGGDGMNILFADDHVEFFRMVDAQNKIARYKSGVGP